MHRDASGEKDEIERGQGVHKLLTGDRQGKTGIWAGSPNKLEAGKNGEVAGVDAGALLSSTADEVIRGLTETDKGGARYVMVIVHQRHFNW